MRQIYEVVNESNSPRLIYTSAMRAIEVKKGGSSGDVELPDGTAIAIRRLEMRGDKLKIIGKSTEADKVLERATIPEPKRQSFSLTGKQRKDFPPRTQKQLSVRDGVLDGDDAQDDASASSDVLVQEKNSESGNSNQNAKPDAAQSHDIIEKTMPETSSNLLEKTIESGQQRVAEQFRRSNRRR